MITSPRAHQDGKGLRDVKLALVGRSRMVLLELERFDRVLMLDIILVLLCYYPLRIECDGSD